MELIYVNAEMTIFQSIMIMLLVFGVVGFIITLTLGLLEQNWESKKKFLISAGLIASIWITITQVINLSPHNTYVYKVDEPTLLIEYENDYIIYNTNFGLYKLIKK